MELELFDQKPLGKDKRIKLNYMFSSAILKPLFCCNLGLNFLRKFLSNVLLGTFLGALLFLPAYSSFAMGSKVEEREKKNPFINESTRRLKVGETQYFLEALKNEEGTDEANHLIVINFMAPNGCWNATDNKLEYKDPQNIFLTLNFQTKGNACTQALKILTIQQKFLRTDAHEKIHIFFNKATQSDHFDEKIIPLK